MLDKPLSQCVVQTPLMLFLLLQLQISFCNCPTLYCELILFILCYVIIEIVLWPRDDKFYDLMVSVSTPGITEIRIACNPVDWVLG